MYAMERTDGSQVVCTGGFTKDSEVVFQKHSDSLYVCQCSTRSLLPDISPPSNLCILMDIKQYLIVILTSIALLSCECESTFMSMLAFQECFLCIISSHPRESVFSTLCTNQTIFSLRLWRVTFTVSQIHIQTPIVFVLFLFHICSVYLFCISLYCLYYNGLFLQFNIMNSNSPCSCLSCTISKLT